MKRNILQSEDLSSFNANDYSELLNSVREKVLDILYIIENELARFLYFSP